MGCAASSKPANPKDSAKQRAKYEEEPENPLPDGEIGDCRLGVNLGVVEASYSAESPYVDADFPADHTSLYYSTKDDSITWARPKDIVSAPQMQVAGVDRSDIVQGRLGDCWFLSSCAALCHNKQIMKKVLPDVDSCPLFGPGYTGYIRVRFWRFGEWTEVIIDDQLPVTKRGDQCRLVFARSSDETEFWVPFLEKAYAKLHGSYEAMVGGQSMDALVDLTGGVSERADLKDIKGRNKELAFYKHMLRVYKSGGFITCNRNTSNRAGDKSTGLVSGHAYSVTAVEQVRNKSGKHANLLRVRNPWGDAMEWKGAWSDNDHMNWQSAVDSSKLRVQADDGEFWMNFSDFKKNFDTVTTCTLNPDLDGDGDGDEALPVQSANGQWSARSAGGCRNNIDAFINNPQFSLVLHEPGDYNPDYDDPSTKDMCQVVISLMQEHRRSQRHLGVKMLQIGFVLYKMPSPKDIVTKDTVMYTPDSGTSGVYYNIRETTARFELTPGNYVIIPSTFHPNEHGSFLVRVFSGSKFKLTGPINR